MSTNIVHHEAYVWGWLKYRKMRWLNVSVCVALAMHVVFTASAAAFNRNALLVFGDSLVDSGNNNFIPSFARADSRPYGIDFPTHQPTGRFSNGKNLPDIICERLGIPLLLPYLDPKNNGNKLLHGANFASAGVGILNDTGDIFMSVIKIQQQFEFFKQYQRRVAAIIGVNETKKMVQESLVSITLGGNDYVNNYFLPMSSRASQYSISNYTTLLVKQFKKQLTRCFRKIMVTSIGPLGCVPSVLSRSSDGECDKQLMQAAGLFDSGVEIMLQELRFQFPDAKFLFASGFDGQQGFMTDPTSFGFENSKTACCGQGNFNGQGLCLPFSNLCSDRSKFVFWDAFHPTERACEFIVDGLFHGTRNQIRPFNLTTLLARNYPCFGCGFFPAY